MELNQTSICYYEKKLAHISAATESADSIVPDTFPDIGRIVCAYGTAAIKDQTPQNGRLLVSGTVQTTVLYEPENGGKLRRLSVPVTFAHIEDCCSRCRSYEQPQGERQRSALLFNRRLLQS